MATAPEHFALDAPSITETHAVRDDPDREDSVEGANASEPVQPDPRELPMFLGETGDVIDWSDLIRAASWADVVFLGEEHDDGVGHAVQRAIVEDLAPRSRRFVLSMEMLERHEQIIVDDFEDGIIDAETLARLTHSERWAGENSWTNWYQPIIDAARAHQGTIVAANAPRHYVRLARTGGYERLRRLPADRRRFFSLPRSDFFSPYRDRFAALMFDPDPAEDSHDSPHRADDSAVNALFRSQLLWDSTMADSVARALRNGATKVVHLAGRFHVEFDGGTVRELRARRPGAKVLTIVVSRDGALQLREDDRGLAHIVIYSGARPEPEPEADPEPNPESAVETATAVPAHEEHDDSPTEADGDSPTEEPSPGASDPESPATDLPSLRAAR